MIWDAEVILWNTRIGLVHQDENSGNIFFEYDRRFTGSHIELSPFKMPLGQNVYSFPELKGEAFQGLPGLLADSLPDRFGKSVLENWLIRQGRTSDSLSAIEKLCYTGKRGMGALEYLPAIDSPWEHPDNVDVNEMVLLASEILSGREKLKGNARDISMSQLLEFGTSAGGARAKAVISWNRRTGEIRSGQTETAEEFDHYLIKFDGVKGNGDHDLKDKTEYTSIEYAYYLMARDCGIEMNDSFLWEKDGLKHFMTKRFDRKDGGKIHMQTFAALSHTDYNVPRMAGYEDACAYLRRLGIGTGGIEQLFRRMYFNHRAYNLDDHVKNIAFLMDRRGQWSLAPAYDITFAYNPGNRWLRMHQMTINGKADEIGKEDILESGKNMGLSSKRIKSIIGQTDEVVSRWPEYAEQCGITSRTYKAIDKIINKR